MKKWIEINEAWQELIELAQNRCVFGEQLDAELFRTCMKDAYEYFVVGKEEKASFNKIEATIYGLIYGYSCIPAVTDSDYSDEFEASTHIAAELAQAIMHPEVFTFENSKMIYEFMIDGDFKPVTYDFEVGDMSDYVELVKMHYWDW